MSSTCKNILILVGAILIIPLLLIEQGWAISTLWGWFIVPLGVPAIGIASAIGIAITFSVLRYSHNKTDEGDKWERMARLVLTPVIAVCLGWIAKQFA